VSIRLYAISCGWLTMPLEFFLDGEEGELRLPVPSYLIDHPKGKVLYDAGMSHAARDDPKGYLGKMRSHIKIDYQEGEEIGSRLEAMDVDIRDLRYLISSHLHFDHVGGIHQLPDSQLVVQRREWAAGQEPDDIKRYGYFPKEYDLGHDVLQVDGEHDLFGDGSVVCLPSHGHTPGHQSVKVRLDSGDVVLAGDACYMRRSLENLHLPKWCHDRDAMLGTLKMLRDLQAKGARIFYGHDPDFWATLPQAPDQVV
jgi:N-acyl homoserine lactone hydrolase